MNMPALKIDLIRWLTDLQDQSTLEAIQTLKNQQLDELSEEHKKLLDERITSYKENPEQVLDWKIVAAEIEKNL